MDWNRFNTFKKNIENKNVLILGLGLQGGGVGAVKFFHELSAKLRVTDLKTEAQLKSSLEKTKGLDVERYHLGKHCNEDVDWADVILLNPDVPHDAPILQYAISCRKRILMEEALFLNLCPLRDVVGITGTRGKTTTTNLINKLLKTQYPTIMAGNISGSETLMMLHDIKNENTKIVLELSNFQLYGFHLAKISPHIAVFTNIYEDHLNKYPSMAEYIHDKKAIYLFQNADDFFITSLTCYHDLNHDNKGKMNSNLIFYDKNNVGKYTLKLKGGHNAENYAAAFQAAKLLNVNEENIKKVFAGFSGVPFRQETIRVINGITFVNDTTATTPTAAMIALDAFHDKNIILIAGGNSKNCAADEFVKKAAVLTDYIVLLKGNATEKFRDDLVRHGKKDAVSEIFDDFGAAVARAYSKAKDNAVVLLSPGFTSFGMFENEFDRGRQFNEYVKKLNPDKRR